MSDLAQRGHLGDGISRADINRAYAAARRAAGEADRKERLAEKNPFGKRLAEAEAARRKADEAAEALRALVPSLRESRERAPTPALTDAEIRAIDLAALEAEEAGKRHGPKVQPFLPPRIHDLPKEARTREAVARFLPPELAGFLERMIAKRREERETALLKKVGWDGLEVLGLPPVLLAERAEKAAKAYAARFPKADAHGNPINQESVHRMGRCEKCQRRRLRKLQRKALRYAEQLVGGVGGPKVPGRPLFISDYGLEIVLEEEAQTLEKLGRMRLVMKNDPSVQVPMLDLHWAAKERDAAKRRLLIDANLMRWQALGWSVCWMTVTLPPEYVANATNEQTRVTEWDLDLGPDEAMKRIQDDHHRVLAALREKGVRPAGFWTLQPQQSGTPHRHYVVACETLDDARKVCDEFHRRFDTGNLSDDGQDRGCSAYVIGDDHPDYHLRRGKNGKEETATSVAKYTARYSTRYEARKEGDGAEGDDGETARGGEGICAGRTEQARFRAWKKLRGARGMGFLGLDSQRAPLELWDILWVNSLKGDDRDFAIEDARMSIAMREMKASRKAAEGAAAERAAAKAAREVLDTLKAAGASSEELTESEAEACEAETAMREASDAAAFHGWHAAVAMGMWPDADLDRREVKWLNDAVAEWNQERWVLPATWLGAFDPLPPVPLREERESVYGVERKEIRGAVGVGRRFTLSSRRADTAELFATAANARFARIFEKRIQWKQAETGKAVNPSTARRLFFLAARDAGLGLSRRPDGTIAGFDLSGEILMRSDDEWMIVTVEEAERLKEEVGESGGTAAPSSSPDGLSFSATDPRLGPDGPHHGATSPPT